MTMRSNRKISIPPDHQLRSSRIAATVFPLLLSISLAILAGCSEQVAEAFDTPAPKAFEIAIDQNQSFWWTFLGPQSTAVANFGPPIQITPDRSVRRWSLVVYLGNTSEPLSCIQGVLEKDDIHPITLSGESFDIQLFPRDGKTWGMISSDLEIESSLVGFE